MQLNDLNAIDRDRAERAFLRCCGSTRWARMMTDARPFDSVEATAATADDIWLSLDRADWLEAVAAHPQIGAGGAGKAEWSEHEQSRVAEASADVRERLASRNRDYVERFGYIFIICATGKSADEMLATLEQRLTNAPDAELRIAAEEQRRITQLRLRKLLEEQ
jgi:OHCU decarboxylase